LRDRIYDEAKTRDHASENCSGSERTMPHLVTCRKHARSSLERRKSVIQNIVPAGVMPTNDEKQFGTKT
jgi:hypothetical protein